MQFFSISFGPEVKEKTKEREMSQSEYVQTRLIKMACNEVMKGDRA